MKVTLKSRKAMTVAIETVCEHFNVNPADVVTTSTKWTIWNKAYMNTAYGNSNANVIFVNDKRMIAYNPEFELYPDGSNDASMQTALNWIFSYLSEKQLTK